MVRGDSSSGTARRVWTFIGVGVFLALVALAGLRFVNPLFPATAETSCTLTDGVDDHHVRRGPDYSTITTDCGVYYANSEVTCAADPSRTVHLVAGVTYDFTVRGPRIPIFSDPTVMDAQVATVQLVRPEPETELSDDPMWDDLKALRDSRSPEVLRPFDYEQPPFDPACDSWRTLMTTDGLQMFSIPRSEQMLTVPEGEVARDPKLPCVGWKCDLE
nr:hypothetical protein [Microbacterium hydrocarbonoxydans]